MISQNSQSHLPSNPPKVALLMTGSELMSGDTIDSNSAYIAQCVKPIGLAISRKVTLGDQAEALKEEVEQLSRTHDLLIINGGLGPTADDLTAAVLAEVTGCDLEVNSEAKTHLQQWAARLGIKQLNQANLKQALLPKGCVIIPNAIGSAVGIQLQHKGCLILSTPGVPSELKAMMNDALLPQLSDRFQLSSIPIRRWRLFGIGESRLQEAIDRYLEQFKKEHPECSTSLECVDIGFRASMPLLELKLLPNIDRLALQRDQVEASIDRIGDGIENHFSDMIVGKNNDSLQEILVALLAQAGKTLTVAESCTGGLIASRITQVSGSSNVFEAGFVTYANTIKESVLGVPAVILEREGAVSEACVEAMAQGALQRSGADYVVAVSGIAGPTGGSDLKPVGTVWIAWGDKTSIQTARMVYRAPRKIFQSFVAAASMDLIRRELLNIEKRAHYLNHFS